MEAMARGIDMVRKKKRAVKQLFKSVVTYLSCAADLAARAAS